MPLLPAPELRSVRSLLPTFRAFVMVISPVPVALPAIRWLAVTLLSSDSSNPRIPVPSTASTPTLISVPGLKGCKVTVAGSRGVLSGNNTVSRKALFIGPCRSILLADKVMALPLVKMPLIYVNVTAPPRSSVLVGSTLIWPVCAIMSIVPEARPGLLPVLILLSREIETSLPASTRMFPASESTQLKALRVTSFPAIMPMAPSPWVKISPYISLLFALAGNWFEPNTTLFPAFRLTDPNADSIAVIPPPATMSEVLPVAVSLISPSA